MKTFSLLAVTALCATLAGTAVAADATALKGCAAKQASIRTQIDYAKAHGNSHQEAGLQTALDHSVATCTDAGLRQAREAKVADAQREITQRQADLDAAKQKGDSGKIAKREKKLNEALEDLEEAKAELDK